MNTSIFPERFETGHWITEIISLETLPLKYILKVEMNENSQNLNLYWRELHQNVVGSSSPKTKHLMLLCIGHTDIVQAIVSALNVLSGSLLLNRMNGC